MKRLAIAIVIGLFAFTLNALAISLEPSDVSILLPLPKTKVELDAGLSPGTTGKDGAILPKDVFALLPSLMIRKNPGSPNALVLASATAYEALRVVSIRVDPCFPSLIANFPSVCQSQIRLVLQPFVSVTGEEMLTPADAAIHLFYEIPRSEFISFIQKIREIKRLQAFGNSNLNYVLLDVNPFIGSQGLSGPYFQTLKTEILKVIGPQNFFRMTFMALRGDGREWEFGQLDKMAGTFQAVAIPNMKGSTVQQVGGEDQGDASHAFSMEPEPEADKDSILKFLNLQDIAGRPKVEVEKDLEALLRIENPIHHNPTTTDCVSCHLANNLRLKTEKLFAIDTTNNPFRYQASLFPLAARRDDGGSLKSLRAFGYLQQKVIISQRTTNESASVAEYINATEGLMDVDAPSR